MMSESGSFIIKVCGITNLADARYAASVGATHLGFIQHPGSPRYVEPSIAADIIEWIFGTRSVGVFVNEPPASINAIAEQTGFDWIQLHGDESVVDCSQIDRPVVKAFRLKKGDLVDDVARKMEPFRQYLEYFLLDAFCENEYGGTGRRIGMDLACELSERFPVILAGGLSPSNIAGTVARIKPLGVDVSTGLEREPGIKDYEIMDAFFSALREAACA